MIVRKGFTLVEMLLVVLILAVLASIVVPRIASSTTSSNNAKDDANWAMLVRALELYAVNNAGVYPTNNTAFQADILNSSTYFPHGATVCPYGNAYVYVGDATGGTVTKHTAGN